ncbi:MAG TPA: siderophore-interacting protein, partial [Actinomycetales bacterium]
MTAVPTMTAFETTVVAVQQISPSMRRVTLTSPELANLHDGGAQGPRDLRVKVMIPSPGTSLPDLSVLDDGWYSRWLAIDASRRGYMRTYTLRCSRLTGERPEVDIDFVLHGEGDHSGPASSWARDAEVGDVLTVVGQDRRSGAPCGGIEWRPPSGPHPRVLLAGDETAAPAICSILESLPADAVGHAVVEVPQAEDFQQVRCPVGVDVVWLARHDRPRGVPLIAAVDAALGVTDGSVDATSQRLRRNG